MSTRLLCFAVLPLLAGCATRLPSTGFAEPAALEGALQRYYAGHATEQHGYCLSPYISGLTQTEMVAQQPERLVVDVRYLYQDRFKNSDDNGGHECTGYAGRRFTFGKGPGGAVEVLDMTGPRRS